MICYVYDHGGANLVRTEQRDDPPCGTYCDNCGCCLHCSPDCDYCAETYDGCRWVEYLDPDPITPHEAA